MKKYRRFNTPTQGEQFQSEYDLPSDLLLDLQNRDISPLVVTTLDLSSAGSLWINIPGRAFVPYFFVTGSAQKTRAPSGLVTVYVNQSDSSNAALALPSKHNRGFRGSFSQVYLTWSAQAATSVDFVILRSELTPWMTDDLELGGASVQSVSATSPVTSTGGGTPVIGMPAATSSVDGYLSHTDWITFNGKQAAGAVTAVTGTAPVASSGGTTPAISMPAATGSVDGYLSHIDWATFNGKQAAGSYQPAGSYLTEPGSPVNHGVLVGTAGVATNATGAGTAGQYLQSKGASTDPAFASFVAPTVQKFTSGSGTYTTPTSPAPLYIRVRMVGGGGGGGGGGSGGGAGNAGTASTASTFGTSLLSAGAGGGGGSNGGVGGSGGGSSLGTGPIGVAFTGGVGGSSSTVTGASFNSGGGGAATPFGGAGGGQSNNAGPDGKANTGSGGGGGGTGNLSGVAGGCGGGAGGFIDAIISSPAASYSYVVGVGGSAGSAGTSSFAGGAGAAGLIEVTEYYQ